MAFTDTTKIKSSFENNISYELCERCEKVRYCNMECAKANWENHKAWCFRKETLLKCTKRSLIRKCKRLGFDPAADAASEDIVRMLLKMQKQHYSRSEG